AGQVVHLPADRDGDDLGGKRGEEPRDPVDQEGPMAEGGVAPGIRRLAGRRHVRPMAWRMRKDHAACYRLVLLRMSLSSNPLHIFGRHVVAGGGQGYRHPAAQAALSLASVSSSTSKLA